MKSSNKFGLVLLMMILGVLITSCLPTEKLSVEINENNTVIEDKIIIPEKIAEPKSVPAPIVVPVIVPEPEYDPELVKLMDKNNKINNYKIQSS